MIRSGKQRGTPGKAQHIFSQAPQANIPRSRFNRSHGYKTTFDAGYLVPIFVDEVLPGDTFSLHLTAFARMSTPVFPIMDNMYLDTFFFFVPNRLLWSNWEKFNGAQDNPGDSIDFTVPTATSVAVTGYAASSLQDYMGIPAAVPGITHSNFWPRAYNLIYNDWFRDENLQDSVVVDIDDGPDDPADYVLLRRGKRHDYFTSCLPWPQKGDAVSLPLGTSAPVVSTGNPITIVPNAAGGADRNLGMYASVTPAQATFYSGTALGGNDIAHFGTDTGLEADLSTATAATINDIRLAFQTQKLLERDARGGTRYIEIIKSHFGVTSPDSRLQRPEYLGGGSTPVNISPISQTSQTDTTPLGTLAAFATCSPTGHGFNKSFVEHGVILGLAAVRADLNYQQGLNRMWSRSTRYDFYWPAFAHIGEQEVLNQELYMQGTANPTEDADVFGYQERYAEYRYKPSNISGEFRSSFTTTLDSWHLAQDFASLPTLNASFIVENPPVDRILAVTDGPQFLFDAFFDLKCARPMPIYSVPGFIDHF